MHTAPPPSAQTASPSSEDSTPSRRSTASDPDLKYIRLIYPSARSGPCIIAASEQAWHLGVRPGMPLAEARSMAQPTHRRPTSKKTTKHKESTQPNHDAVQFRLWEPAEDRKGLCEAAEHTRRFAPIVSLDELPAPDSLLLDITGCAPLFGSESSLGEQLIAQMRQVGYRCRVAIADSVAGAWAFAHIDGPSWDVPLSVIPPGLQSEYFGPLPLSAARLQPADIDILHQLGVRTLKALLNLPREDLPARLSADGVTRILQLIGAADELMIPLPEADPVCTSWSSEYPAENRNEICEVLQHLLTQITEQLDRRRLGCIRIECELTSGSGIPGSSETIQLAAEVIRATQDQSILLEVLQLRLESIPISSPVFRIRMHATTSPLPQARQKDLFSTADHLVPQDELAALVNRLSSRLGPAAVGTVRITTDPRPEHTIEVRPVLNSGASRSENAESQEVLHRLVTPSESDQTIKPSAQAHSDRPLRLLPVPWLLPTLDSATLMSEGLHWQGRRERIVAIYGPERFQTSWWTEQPVHRDYYRAETAQGSLFWLFRDLSNGRWFIHGLFD
ncbi:MAG: DNA polymerase Y family protein [Planctomyces sp.]|nr:DNA polymerase Y family protein [Planctomyces sp.]